MDGREVVEVMASPSASPQSASSIERLVSAGGVIYRMVDGRMEVALCGRGEGALWALPKGTPELDETIEQTALREAREETGLQVEIEAPLGNITYWFQHDGIRCFKTVHFHLMRPVGGALDKHDPEFDVVQWFPVDEALRVMTYTNETTVVRAAVERVRGSAPV
ncbi:MAG: NUDIX hydrolase [Chloroflexota bacterium]